MFYQKARPSAGALLGSLVIASCAAKEPESPDTNLPRWEPGYFDIHHISVDGDATFMIFPDGTTLLFDAGVRDKEEFEARVPPLKAASRRPGPEKQSGAWYSQYIEPMLPSGRNVIDYGVISHFDADHYGLVTEESPLSQRGAFLLSGVTEVDELIGIGTLIDRGYPDYTVPTNMVTLRANNLTFQNYLRFIEWRDGAGQTTAQAIPGSLDQIVPVVEREKVNEFYVRVVKSNHHGWSGVGDDIFEIFAPEAALRPNGGFPENPFSIALKFDYGMFDYFTGGDMLGPPDYTHDAWQDSETPLSAVIGEVDAFALNHHGVRDANNEAFIAALRPRVSVMSGGTSDHPGQEVFYRLMSKSLFDGPSEFFATHVFNETRVTYGPWFAEQVDGRTGHVVIRVAPGGAQYMVYVLDDRKPGHHVIATFGPYDSR